MGKILCVKKKSETWKFNSKDVLYVKQDGREVNIVTNRMKISEYGSLEDYVVQLREGFYRCHKYCLINFNNVCYMKSGEIFFENGECVYLGENNFRATRQAFHAYFDNEVESVDSNQISFLR